MAQDNNVKAFLALLRAGLWEQVNDNENFVDGLSVNWADVIRLAEEQSVVGIVAAGVERLSDYSLPLTEKLTLLGKCQLIEQQNVAMNQFLGELVEKMRRAGIYTLLLKGQGIAQCYERPLWRSCGDIDFFLNDDNYDKAKVLLCPLSSTTAKETEFRKHLPLTIQMTWPDLQDLSVHFLSFISPLCCFPPCTSGSFLPLYFCLPCSPLLFLPNVHVPVRSQL